MTKNVYLIIEVYKWDHQLATALEIKYIDIQDVYNIQNALKIKRKNVVP